MKKIFLLIVSMIGIPYVLCFFFCLFYEGAHLGQGGNSVEEHPLGRRVLIEMRGLYKSMDVEEYVLGVLPGTIPADYEDEALEVQAILIRTNVLKEMQEKGTEDAADLSYQYLTVEERIELFGEHNYEKTEERFERAVVRTSGKVVEFENNLAMAMYHAVSIGKTASAKEILDDDISYLQSVDSSQDVEAKNYMSIVSYSWQELQEIVGKLIQETQQSAEVQTTQNSVINSEEEITETVSDKPVKTKIKVEESTENGFVKKVSVNGSVYTGEEVKEYFQLSSTNFYVEEMEDGLRFVCLGKGNGLGVSQYGANRMAKDGKTAEEIIKYYLKNVSIKEYSTKSEK